MRGPTPEEVRHYSRLIRGALGDTFLFAPETEIGPAVQVERGSVYPMCLCGHREGELNARVDRLLEGPPQEVTVVDRAGQSRSAYLGLLVYSWIQAFRIRRQDEPRNSLDRWPQAIGAWCGMLEAALNRLDWPIGGLPAARGAGAAASVWNALALHAAGAALNQRRWSELAANTFGRLAAGQQHSGAFLRATAADNPETRWYHELVLLHAAASYAVQSNDTLVTAGVMQAADYHVREIQPDHATTQPWGLFAFVWRRDARDLADGMLHALASQHAGPGDGVSSLLLADALYCLRLV